IKEFALRDPSEVGLLAADIAPGANGLCFLPYLSPAGERVPFLNTAARGSLFGLSLEHNRSHIARAILEGLSLVIRECLETAQQSYSPPAVCGLCGGCANSDVLWPLIAGVNRKATPHTLDHLI